MTTSHHEEQTSEALDRSQPPAPQAGSPFRFPEGQRSTLTNGLEVVTVTRPGSPVCYAEIVLPAGAENEPSDRPGLATFAIALMDEGTPTRSSTEMAAAVESVGGFLTTSAGWNSAYLSFGSLEGQLPFLMELAAETLATPAFDPSEIDRLRTERMTEIARRRADPASIAALAVPAILYRDGIYSTSLIGTEESLESMDRNSIVAYHEGRVRAHGSTLIVVGSLDHASVVADAEELLGRWSGEPTNPAVLAEPEALPTREVHLYDRPGASQTELRIAHLGVRRNHPDSPALSVMNAILGGKFTSRLNLNLREKHGFTYGVHSQFSRRKGRGPFTIQSAISTDDIGEAVRETFTELERLRTESVTEAELDDTKSYIQGVFPYTLQTNDGLAQRLVDLAVHALPADYFDRYLERIGEVDREAVLQVAQRHLDPEHAAIVAVGPASELQSQLESFGPVTVHPADER